MTVNHIDGNKYNNRISSLEYCTQSEKFIHALVSGLIEPAKGVKNGNVTLTENDVRQIRKRLALVKAKVLLLRLLTSSTLPLGVLTESKHGLI